MTDREDILVDPLPSTDKRPQPINWDEPIPLSRLEPSRLPINMWPPVLRDYAYAAAASSETPEELPAMMALAVTSAAVQTGTAIEIKAGYAEPVCIYTAVIMPPGTRKSAE